jgi:hypothetical protein
VAPPIQKCAELERQVQTQLQEARAADGVLNQAQAAAGSARECGSIAHLSFSKGTEVGEFDVICLVLLLMTFSYFPSQK